MKEIYQVYCLPKQCSLRCCQMEHCGRDKFRVVATYSTVSSHYFSCIIKMRCSFNLCRIVTLWSCITYASWSVESIDHWIFGFKVYSIYKFRSPFFDFDNTRINDKMSIICPIFFFFLTMPSTEHNTLTLGIEVQGF